MSPSPLKGAVLAAACALCLSPSFAQTSSLPTGRTTLSPQALRQIDALEADANARTPAQRKISSQLIYTLRLVRGQQIARGVTQVHTGVTVSSAGLTLIDVDAAVTPDLLHAIVRMGGSVVHASPDFGQVRARLPLAALETLAGTSGVRFIRPAVQAQLNTTLRHKNTANFLAPYVLPVPKRVGVAVRAAAVRAALPGLLSRVAAAFPGPVANTGSVTSEGDKTHQADKARSTYGVSGSGIKVGVLSDSIDDENGSYAAAVASGDVSSVTVISGQEGSGEGEGLAMLEIVHDLAPSAKLYFASGFNGPASMADNIVALQKAGCKVIIDDVSYFNESPFQDATIAQGVNTVTAAGAMFFSSAANNGNLDSGTSSVWEGDFKDSGDTISDGKLHLFTTGIEGNAIQTPYDSASLSLFWSDPLGKSSNDYDLFVFSPDGSSVVASSTDRQTGSQDPYESADAADGDLIAIVQHSGSTRFLHLDINNQNSILNIATNGRTRGHNAGLNTFSCAATDASAVYPSAFSTSDTYETFSDDGGRHIFFNPDGSAITSSLTHTGGKVLNKPDFTAADGVTTTLPAGGGLNPFYGTSASAPHAGAIAALMLSRNPALTRAQVASILDSTAIDIAASGYDRDSGYGILNALDAVKNTPTSTGAVTPKSLTFNPNPVVGGQDTTGTITLTGAAPSGGAAVTITENGSSLGTITVAAGSTSTTFTLTTSAVTASETDTFGAVYGGATVTTSLTLTPVASAVTISSVVLTPTSVTAGSTSTGKITLSAVAPTGGATISLKSSDTASATVPSSVTIAAGNKSISFTVTSKSVTSTKTVTITATAGSSSKTATLTVTPAASAVTVKSLSVSPTSVVGGSATSTGTVTLTGAAPSAGLSVSLKSSYASAATVSSTLNVPAGATSAKFKITTKTVTSTKTVTITATAGSTSKTATLTVTGSGGTGTVTAKSLTATPSSVSSNGQTLCVITLSGAAPSGGASVPISANGTVFYTVTVPAGQTSASFNVTWSVVNSTSTNTLSAAYGGKTVSTTVIVNPTSVTLKSYTFSPNPITGGQTATAKVTLSAAAPAGGAVINITYNGAAHYQFVIPAGATSGTYTQPTSATTSTQAFVFVANYNGASLSKTLTVNP